MNNEANNTATARTKNQLRYAIKTKTFSDTDTTLAAALNVASDWITFRKSDWLYKHNDYVAGAGFDSAAGGFTYYLKTDGTIIRRGGHTKLNERGEEVLRQQLTHRLYTLKNSPVFKSLEHTSYADTLGVYVSLFGDRPYGH